MIATSWICFCFSQKKVKNKKKKSGISTNPRAGKQPFSAGDKNPIVASVTSEMSIAGARLERGDMDMAWNISKRKGNQMLTKHWALEVTSDCCALA